MGFIILVVQFCECIVLAFVLQLLFSRKPTNGVTGIISIVLTLVHCAIMGWAQEKAEFGGGMSNFLFISLLFLPIILAIILFFVANIIIENNKLKKGNIQNVPKKTKEANKNIGKIFIYIIVGIFILALIFLLLAIYSANK